MVDYILPSLVILGGFSALMGLSSLAAVVSVRNLHRRENRLGKRYLLDSINRYNGQLAYYSDNDMRNFIEYSK